MKKDINAKAGIWGMIGSIVSLLLFGLLLYYVGGAIIGVFGWIIGGIIVYFLFFR